MMLFAALQLQVSKSTNAARLKINLFWSFKLGSFLFFKVAMQANVPQPAADEDDGDDVDEGRWRHDSFAALSVIIVNKKSDGFLLQFFNLNWFDAIVNSAVQRLEVLSVSET